MRYLSVLLPLLLLGCPSPAAPPAAVTVDAAAVERAAGAAFEAYVAHANAGEWDQALALYSNDPSFYWVEDGAVAYPSKAELRQAVESIYGTVQEARLTSEDVRVTALRGDLAWLTASWEQSLTLESGQSFSYGGVTTILLEKVGADWTFRFGHNSSFKPRGG